MAKHIFVTGGVVSSLGKGLNSASIGMLLESRGLKVSLQKFDPYVNVDSGTMSPYEHGEVYVTEDGAETDLDLGHYERYTNAAMNRNCNWTTGSIYYSVIMKERQGEYLGKTVQVIPHVTNEIKSCIKKMDDGIVDVIITEIGGIIGDIESQPFVEAIRQFGNDIGKGNVLYIHLTLIPYLRAADEIKTKPTQHSVGILRQLGIQPDILICRTEKTLTNEIKNKIALFCNIDKESIIEEKDVKPILYKIPLVLKAQGLDRIIIEKLNLNKVVQNANIQGSQTADATKKTEKLSEHNGEFSKWLSMIQILKKPKHSTEIAIVGKYIGHQSSYESVYESLIHGGIANNAKVIERRIESEDIEKNGTKDLLKGCMGILIPGGFGERGIDGKIETVKFARENNIPFLGLCLGMHCAVIEFARNVCGLKGSNSTEFDPAALHPVISLLEEQQNVKFKGGTMRLGAHPCKLKHNTRVYEAYNQDQISERHRHRYEFNGKYQEILEKNGMVCSGMSPDNKLVEIVELKDHIWFVAVQFHPEFKSKPTKSHPLFREFIKASLDY